MTICCAEFTLATSTTCPCAASRATASTASSVRPMMAAMAPAPTGTACCMSSPRLRTTRTASARRRAPATTSAEYSPRLWPAASAGRRRRSPQAAAAATLAVSTAGCVLAVSASSLSGPSNITPRRSKPRAALASAKTARAPAEASWKALPMPTACEPWPGNRNAIIGCRLPAHQRGAPREATAEGRDQDQVALLDAPARQRLLHRDVHGGGARVAVAVHVDEDALHRQADALGRRLDDPEIRLVRDEERHVVGREAVAGENALGALGEHAHRDLEHLGALHLRVVHPLVDRLVRGGVARAAPRHVEEVPVLAVGEEVEVDGAALVGGRLEHGRAGGVGEQHAGDPVGTVGDLGRGLAAHACTV